MVAKNLIQRIGQQKAIRLFTEPGGCRRGVFQCSVLAQARLPAGHLRPALAGLRFEDSAQCSVGYQQRSRR
jgi:hypothetical protein